MADSKADPERSDSGRLEDEKPRAHELNGKGDDDGEFDHARVQWTARRVIAIASLCIAYVGMLILQSLVDTDSLTIQQGRRLSCTLSAAICPTLLQTLARTCKTG